MDALGALRDICVDLAAVDNKYGLSGKKRIPISSPVAPAHKEMKRLCAEIGRRLTSPTDDPGIADIPEHFPLTPDEEQSRAMLRRRLNVMLGKKQGEV
jgi:hypothetical protein